ncbi:hypothetical protein FB381_3891 [Nocardioides albertanoniae]|uniref:Hpr(Ser) kinase/phosphatase n=1 Tax=Nocardioides albertanoniae TaxID=1175486 RepID=A0A543ABJ3_9ACTN|nr:hypothetical protein FB381_3891 [Nocardioides albertanoniae]
MSELVRLYGMNIRTEIPTHQHRPVPPGARPDLEINLGPPVPATDAAPPGKVLLDLRGNQQYYTGTQHEDGFSLRFHGTCDIEIDSGLGRAVVHPVTGGESGMLSVLAGGTLLAFVLGLRRAPVLHASAVHVGDEVLAFAGASGMGKSTMATLQCADGAALVTDDLLRLDLTTRRPLCSLGATELRLRRPAAQLADVQVGAGRQRATADDRNAFAPRTATTESLPLATIVVPVIDRDPARTAVRIESLAPLDALLLLTRFPRLLGWRSPAILRDQLDQIGDLVERVPVHVAVVPAGPPFPSGLAGAVRDGVGLAASASTAAR